MIGLRLATGQKTSGGWPRLRIVEALKRAFGSILLIGEDQSHSVYDVEDRVLRFVVALVHESGARAGVTEVGFLARFIGRAVSEKAMRNLAGELHLGSAFVEDGDLYIVAKVAAKGRYTDARFSLVLGAWRRDVTLALAALGKPATAAASEAADAALKSFAFDAGRIKARPAQFAAAFFWRNESKAVCGACRGRGRRGFLPKPCEPCEGTGFQ